MTNFTIEIKGLKKLQGQFKKAPQKTYKELDYAVKRGSLTISRDIKPFVPVDTGNLQRNIRPDFERPLMAVIRPHNAPYGCVFGKKFKVRLKNGLKEIGQVKKGDMVLTQDGTYHKILVTPKMKAILKPNLVDLEIKWRKDKNHKLTLTQDHKVLVSSNNTFHWVEAGKLKIGDKVLQPIKIDKNKGKGKKYIYKICKFCGKKYQGNGKLYCSQERTGKALENIKKANKIKMYDWLRRKKKTKSQIQVGKWLDELGIKYKEEYSIGHRFVDFYAYKIGIIFESDGSYWHRNQNIDIKRDKELLKYKPNCKIIHIHFADYRFSKNIKKNPLKNVYYIQVNPSMKSYVNLDCFEETEILKAKKWKYKRKWTKDVKLYDLTVDKIHSFVVSGIIVSNSIQHEIHKTKSQFFPKGLAVAKPEVERLFNKAVDNILRFIASK